MGDDLIWVSPEADSEIRIHVVSGTLRRAWRSETGWKAAGRVLNQAATTMGSKSSVPLGKLWGLVSSSHLRGKGAGVFIYPLLQVIGRGLPAMCGMEGISDKRNSLGKKYLNKGADNGCT